MLDPSSRPLVFATADHRRQRGRAFGILPADLLRHVYVVGKTGMGKSALLERLFLAVVERGMGCALLDPHGDLAERVLDRIPSWRLNDVVWLDPADVRRPIGLNLLEHAHAGERPLVASSVLGTFKKVFHEFWGPRLEHVFRMTLLALLDVPGTTLLGVLRMLVDEGYRSRIVARVRDPLVRHYWTREFPAYGASFAAEVVAPVQNKVGAVLSYPALRLMFGQSRSTLHPRRLMDEGRIVVANLAKGRLGEDASAFVGAVLATSFQLAAYARADVPESARRPFVLVMDEFASFVTQSFAELLAEARKYGLGLVMAHQYLAQLDDNLRAAVTGNAGTTIAFRVGADDAHALAPEFVPELTASDLGRLARHQIALRLSVDGVTSMPFTAETLAPVAGHEGHAGTICRISAERYGRARAEVERSIATMLGAAP
jgi:hypothetical protein